MTASSSCLRYWCTKAMAMLPSPTAEATRLTGANRTSPHAKMPGTLVSRRYGSPVELPASRGGHIGARRHKAAAVECYLRRQPLRLGVRPDEDKESVRLGSGR